LDSIDQKIGSEVINSMEQGVIVWSESGECMLVNPRFYRLLNQDEDYLHVGMHRSQYYHSMIENGDATPEMVEGLEQKLLTREPFTIERELESGAIFAVYIRPIHSGGHVVTYTDISDTIKDQQALQSAMARAETAELQAREALQLEQEVKEETRSLTDLSDWLQCSKSLGELYEIVRQAMTSMFEGTSGQLFIYSNSRDVLDGAVSWGDTDFIRNIMPDDCWSLRRGRRFVFGNGVIKYPCAHIHSTSVPNHYLCLPVIAQGDTVGLLHIAFDSMKDSSTPLDENQIAFAQRCSELISMAIANVKLRDELHQQSTRDALTGLFNRRYFLDQSRAAISKIERDGGSVALISFDADNFKSYNDTYGHDAGDYLLCTLGELTTRFFNDYEICCRIGGEEFSVLIADSNSTEAVRRARQFIKTIENHEFRYREQLLPKVTVSAGVASYPEHATSLQDLTRIADVAMYDAKELGKNQVATPGTSTTPDAPVSTQKNRKG